MTAPGLEMIGAVIAGSPEKVAEMIGGKFIRQPWQSPPDKEKDDTVRLEGSLVRGDLYQVGQLKFILENNEEYLDVLLSEIPYLTQVG